jgi:hypothetical protein
MISSPNNTIEATSAITSKPIVCGNLTKAWFIQPNKADKTNITAPISNKESMIPLNDFKKLTPKPRKNTMLYRRQGLC